MKKGKNIKNNENVILESILEEVLGGKFNKSLDELLKGTPNKKNSEDNLKKAADIINKKIEKEMKKIKNNEKQLLVDSPVDVSKTIKEEVGLEGFISPEHAAELTEKNAVRLINVNKTVNDMLEVVEHMIIDATQDGKSYIVVDFFDGYFAEALKKVRLVTVEKVINRLTDYISSLGYNVDLDTWEEESKDGDCDFELYAHLTISW